MAKFLCIFLVDIGLFSAQGQTSAPATSPRVLPSLEYFIGKLPAPPKPDSFRDRLDVREAIVGTNHKASELPARHFPLHLEDRNGLPNTVTRE